MSWHFPLPAKQQHDQEKEGAASGGDILVPAERALEAEERQTHAVQQEQQQHEREEPAAGWPMSAHMPAGMHPPACRAFHKCPAMSNTRQGTAQAHHRGQYMILM